MDLKHYKIGVIMGGVSAEREVSLKSGNAVCKALRELGLSFAEIDADNRVYEKVKSENIDIAFIALHGGWGEDGSIQGMLEIMGVLYTGSGVLASALAMNKEASKDVFMQNGLQVAPCFVVDKRSETIDVNLYRSKGFDLPLFVKPASEGSSVGVGFAKDDKGFVTAVQDAFEHGDRVIVEKYIEGKEVQIGILGECVLGGVEVRPAEDFYSYKAKYTDGKTEYILPPELSPEVYSHAQDVGLAAHRALGCSGATRVDLIVNGSDNIYVLEVNTIPGMTESSLLPKIAALAGYDFKDMIKEILVYTLKTKGKL